MIDKRKAIQKLELMRCNSEWNKDLNEVIDRAIKILRQTDSEDCVSRQAVLDLLAYWAYECEYDEVAELVKKLPPVTPTERTGEWIRKYCFQEWKCSECEYEIDGKTNYCPNCGAKMRDEEK